MSFWENELRRRIKEKRWRHTAAGLLALLFFPLTGVAVEISEVNVFIGTGGRGFGAGSTFPGPARPFGMARPGPDTSWKGIVLPFYHCSGYYYGDDELVGISHTRLSGIGVTEYGNLRLLPLPLKNKSCLHHQRCRARFRHADEKAHPGYYTITLADSGIRIELTASPHCGLHRWTFPPADSGLILIDAGASLTAGGVCEAELKVQPEEREFFGRLVNCGSLTRRNGGVEFFFVVRFDRDFLAYSLAGERGWVEVDVSRPVEAAVGLSFISVEQARRHVVEEVGERGFEAVQKEAEEAWAAELAAVEIEGGSLDQRTIFATALYHALLMPTDVTEAGGLYRGFDEKVHEAAGFRYYTDFSLWDTFRTLHPLLHLLAPARSADMMQSLVLMAEQGGWLPRWPTAYRYTNCMIGSSAANVIADAWARGVRGFNVEGAYAALRKEALHPVPEESDYEGRVGLEEYISLGYVPSDLYPRSASWTIEMSYNDFCIAQLARALGRKDDYELFLARSQNWRSLWDPGSGYLRPRRSDGSFLRLFWPGTWGGAFVEGNARQWLWAPFHDVSGLIELMGGPEILADRLNAFFKKSVRQPDTFLWDNFYWHGNEPDIHAAYLFNYAGRPDLTQKWVRWILETKYKNAPDGLDGNDDAGTLSAWFIFSALGFYPLAGTDLYLLGSPLFPRAVLHLPEGDLVIRAEPDPAENIYVKSVRLNSEVLREPWFRHESIARGGEIFFEMKAAP